MLRHVIDFLFFRHRERDERDRTRRIVARYSRGNVNVQAGRYLTDVEQRRLSAEGDAAARRLMRMRAAHTR